jgi:hypothetical protein
MGPTRRPKCPSPSTTPPTSPTNNSVIVEIPSPTIPITTPAIIPNNSSQMVISSPSSSLPCSGAIQVRMVGVGSWKDYCPNHFETGPLNIRSYLYRSRSTGWSVFHGFGSYSALAVPPRAPHGQVLPRFHFLDGRWLGV